ncbi:MAG TPA: hypothetical protein VF077_00450 [Nitrospiraceae bacterium]
MSFDVNKMLATSYDDALSTQSIPVPEGEYTAMTEKLDFRVIDTKDGQRIILRLTWLIDDADGRVKLATSRDNNMVNQDIWLDMTAEGNLDMSPGMNTQLGRLREMWKQNMKGKAWNFSMLLRNPAKILVNHRTNDKGDTFADVKKVVAL